MPERQSKHPDNDYIDELTENPTPSHQGSAGGEVNRRVGKRGEENSAKDPANREPEVGSDNPQQDAKKAKRPLPRSRIRAADQPDNSKTSAPPDRWGVFVQAGTFSATRRRAFT